MIRPAYFVDPAQQAVLREAVDRELDRAAARQRQPLRGLHVFGQREFLSALCRKMSANDVLTTARKRNWVSAPGRVLARAAASGRP